MSYDFAHDYYGRFRDCYGNGDLGGVVWLLIVVGLSFLFNWLFGQIWFWLTILPLAVGVPTLVWHKTHDKNKTSVYAFVMIILSIQLAVLFWVLSR